MSQANYNFLARKMPFGYSNKIDESHLEVHALVNGSQNVLINDEGNVVKRRGYVLFGQRGSLKQGIQSSFTWPTSSNKQLTFRSYYDVLQVYYQGEYKTILSGLKTYTKFTADAWWNKNEGKDVLLMANGKSSIKSWSGGVTEIASWTPTSVTKKYAKQSGPSNNFVFVAATKTLTQTATDFITLGFKVGEVVSVSGTVNNNALFTIRELTGSVMTFSEEDTIVNETIATTNAIVGVKGRETWRSERFVQTGTKKININGTEFTYTGGEATPTLTLSTDPSSVATVGAFVFQPIIESTPTGIDLPPSFPIDYVRVNLNQAIYASAEFRSVFLSKQSDYLDVDYSALIRKAGEGATIFLDSNVTGISVSDKVLTITAGLSDIYVISFENYSDGTDTGVGELIKVKKLQTGYGQAAVSFDAITNVKNGAIYLSNEPAIDFLGNVQQLGQAVKPLSDTIKRLLSNVSVKDAQSIYFKNYILFLLPRASMFLMYDIERGFWQPPQILDANSFCVYEDKILIHSSYSNDSFTLFESLDDDGKPIITRAVFGIEVYGDRTKRKVYDEVFLETKLNGSTNNLLGKILSGNKGSVNEHPFILGYDEDIDFAEEIPSLSGVGSSPFGFLPVGGGMIDFSEDADIGELKLFRKIETTPIIETFSTQLVFENDEMSSYFEIISYGLNSRLSETTNVDLKK